MAGLHLESMDRKSSCTFPDNQELNLVINLLSWSGLFWRFGLVAFMVKMSVYIDSVWCSGVTLESNGKVGKQIYIFKITCNKITRKEKYSFGVSGPDLVVVPNIWAACLLGYWQMWGQCWIFSTRWGRGRKLTARSAWTRGKEPPHCSHQVK